MPVRQRTTDILTCAHCGTSFPYKQSGTRPNRFCGWDCLQASRTPEGRFWSKVDKDGPLPEACPDRGPCWCWIGALFTDSGYGQFWLDNTNRRAHIVSYEWANGPVPDGLIVCHRCDTPSCVRPSHLYAGTSKQNAEDRDSRGRTAIGDRHWTRTHPERLAHQSGDTNGNAKLTDADIIEIRQDAASGIPQIVLARRRGVSPATICNIVKRRSWAHVL